MITATAQSVDEICHGKVGRTSFLSRKHGLTVDMLLEPLETLPTNRPIFKGRKSLKPKEQKLATAVQ